MTNEETIGRALLRIGHCDPDNEDSVQVEIIFTKHSQTWFVNVYIDDVVASEGQGKTLLEAMIAAQLIIELCKDCPLPGLPNCPTYPHCDADES